MGNFTIPNVYKSGARQLGSGDLTITFRVDRSQQSQVLPFIMLAQDAPVTLTVSDGDVGKVRLSDAADPDRNKKYARIQILSDECGYSDESRRKMLVNLTGKDSRTKLSDEELDTVIKHLNAEANGDNAGEDYE